MTDILPCQVNGLLIMGVVFRVQLLLKRCLFGHLTADVRKKTDFGVWVTHAAVILMVLLYNQLTIYQFD